MTTIRERRPGFRRWLDAQPAGDFPLLPLTHVTKGITAQDIIGAGSIQATECDVLKSKVSYFFYGRPAFRVSGDGAIRLEAACPICFVFDATLLSSASDIYAFDTGAFAKRLYKHVLLEEMGLADFSVGVDQIRLNKLISHVFSSLETYYYGDVAKFVPVETGAKPGELVARAYLELLQSRGRNEPDDRVSTVEVVFDRDVPLVPHLRAIVVPHTLWDTTDKAEWLNELVDDGVLVRTFPFFIGRNPDYYFAQIETIVRQLYADWKLF